MIDVLIVGAGIVGLSTAMQLLQQKPGLSVLVLEKETTVSFHQTGHNSGVIHSGIYYKPGSLKAKMARDGNVETIAFCQQYDIPYAQPGKIIVAVNRFELANLEALYQRGLENGLVVNKLCKEAVNEIEPNVRCVAGIHVPSTGVVNYQLISEKFAALFQAQGGVLKLGCELTNIDEQADRVVVQTNQGPIEARYLIACAGLQSDRIAHRAGLKGRFKIMPFRGEFYQLSDKAAGLVNQIIYPVPNPQFPFLGVHFTRTIDGIVKVGPNAVLSLAREQYKRHAFDLKDTLSSLSHVGLWRFACKHWRMSSSEILRSQFKSLFLKTIQDYFPSVTKEAVCFYKAGVRAQAMDRQGRLIDDFLFLETKRSLHVANAPSPAATAALPIGRSICNQFLSKLLN